MPNRWCTGRFPLFRPRPAPPGASKGSLKLQARVFDRRHLRQSAVFEETGALEDLATLESHLAWRALTVAAPASAPAESEFRSLSPPVPLDALENYIRGLLAPAPEEREVFHPGGSPGPGFLAAGLRAGKNPFRTEGVSGGGGMAGARGPRRESLSRRQFFPGHRAVSGGRFRGRAEGVSDRRRYGAHRLGVEQSGRGESRQNLPQAVDTFRKALDQDPSDPDYHFNVGYALFKKGDFAAAADRFRAVLDRDPGDQMATLLLGRCLKKQGLRAGAASDARLQALERLKDTYEERVYFQLKSILESPAK